MLRVNTFALSCTYAAIPEVEAFRRSQDLGVEVNQERSDGVFVGLRNPIPEALLPFSNLIPFIPGLIACSRTEPMGQQLRDRLALPTHCTLCVNAGFACLLLLACAEGRQNREGKTPSTSMQCLCSWS